MSCNIRASITGCIDSVLKIREDIGAQLADVWIVTRTWTGQRIGEGSFSDVTVKVFPLPQIKDFSHSVRTQEASVVKQGDLVLVGLSRNQYPEEKMLRTDTGSKTIEKMIKVGKHFYRTITVKENVATWDIHVRKINQDETEPKG